MISKHNRTTESLFMVEKVARTTPGRAERIVRRLEELGGPESDEGVERLAFGPGHIRARERVIEWGRGIDLTPHVDPVGNLWLLPAATVDRPLLVGSHLDSVPGGGRFDGALGVLMGLELASERAAARRGSADVAVVDYACEESSRFGVGTLGSSVYAGRRRLEDVMHLKGFDGSTFREARADLWKDVEGEAPAAESFAGQIEVHIDQATELEEAGAALGVVLAIAAASRWRVNIVGAQEHSGAAPMPGRRDALLAAAELALFVRSAAQEVGSPGVRATVGRLVVGPNVANVVPGRAEAVIDLRALETADARRFGESLASRVREIEGSNGVTIDCDQIQADTPATLDLGLTELLTRCARSVDPGAIQTYSWSAHDSLHTAASLPTGMLLVRNRGGASHSPLELATVEDIDAAYRCLSCAARSLLEDVGTGG